MTSMKGTESLETGNSIIWIIPVVLSLAGILMIMSITGRANGPGYTAFEFVYRQSIWLMMGLLVMIIFSRIPICFIKNISGILWLTALVLSFLTMTELLGIQGGGSRRWLRIGPVGFQPFELLSLALTVHLANLLSRDETRTSGSAFIKVIIISFLSIVPLFLQPDMGGAILIFIIAMAIFIEAKGWFMPILLGTLAIPVFIYLMMSEGYRARRYMAFSDPWKEPLDSGYQVIQGLIAFANGGLMGRGVGNGFQKLRYLPAAHTDFIFAAIGEEFGLLGTFFVISLFLLLAIFIFRIFLHADSSFNRILLWGLCVSLLLPFFINVAGVTKLLPLTGMALPFVSYGGSSMLFSWMKIGMVLSISKEAVQS